MIDRLAFERNGYVIVRDKRIVELRKNLSWTILEAARNIVSNYDNKHCNDDLLIDDNIGNFFDLYTNKLNKHDVTSILYRNLPTLPGFIGVIADEYLMKIIKELGIKLPVAGTMPALRIDHPFDEYHRTPAHQDSWFSMVSNNSLTVWFSLRDLTEEMGLLEVIPGSHKCGQLPFVINSKHNNNPFIFENQPLDSRFKAIGLESNEILVFSQNLIHRSGQNRSSNVRLSVQVRYNDIADVHIPEPSYVAVSSDYVINEQKKVIDKNSSMAASEI